MKREREREREKEREREREKNIYIPGVKRNKKEHYKKKRGMKLNR